MFTPFPSRTPGAVDFLAADDIDVFPQFFTDSIDCCFGYEAWCYDSTVSAWISLWTFNAWDAG
jgi:hypothetical protein